MYSFLIIKGPYGFDIEQSFILVSGHLAYASNGQVGIRSNLVRALGIV